MATIGVSYFRTGVDHFKDPQNLFLALSCVSSIAGRAFDICGKDCSQYANLAAMGTIFGDLFDFWDSGKVVQSAYEGIRDVKIILWDHHYNGMSAQEIRRDLNEDMTTQVTPNVWLAERVCLSALKTFGSSVLAFAALKRMGAIDVGPCPYTKAAGAAAGALVNLYSVYTEERKISDGPELSKIKAGDVGRYKDLYDQYHRVEQYQKMTLLFIKCVFVLAAVKPLLDKGSFFEKVSQHTGDMLTGGFSTLAALSLMQKFQSGAEMKQIEKRGKAK